VRILPRPTDEEKTMGGGEKQEPDSRGRPHSAAKGDTCAVWGSIRFRGRPEEASLMGRKRLRAKKPMREKGEEREKKARNMQQGTPRGTERGRWKKKKTSIANEWQSRGIFPRAK